MICFVTAGSTRQGSIRLSIGLRISRHNRLIFNRVKLQQTFVWLDLRMSNTSTPPSSLASDISDVRVGGKEGGKEGSGGCGQRIKRWTGCGSLPLTSSPSRMQREVPGRDFLPVVLKVVSVSAAVMGFRAVLLSLLLVSLSWSRGAVITGVSPSFGALMDSSCPYAPLQFTNSISYFIQFKLISSL